MAINYTQTDSGTGACAGEAGYCAATGNNIISTTEKIATAGGTAGSVEIGTSQFSPNATDQRASIITIIPDSGTSGDSGTWTVRLNITTANMNLSIIAIDICRVNSSCVNQESIGSATGLSISLGSTGVKSQNVTGSAVTLAAGDKVVIVFHVANGSMSGQEFGWIPNQNIDSPFSASANKILTASAGAYTVTGNAASLELGRKVAAAAGSYAITGQTVTLQKNIPIVAGAGSYAVTGAAASLLHDKTLIASAGSYVITGTDAALSKGLTLAASAGSYAVTGTDATLVHDFVLAASAGSYALTGTNATLTRNIPLIASAGSYALTGSAVSLEHGWKLVASAGSYAVTGTNVSLLYGREVVASAGSYAISGTDATLIAGANKALAADAGSYSLSGSNASLLLLRKVIAESGIYLVSGTDADLTIAQATATASAGTALTGHWRGPGGKKRRHTPGQPRRLSELDPPLFTPEEILDVPPAYNVDEATRAEIEKLALEAFADVMDSAARRNMQRQRYEEMLARERALIDDEETFLLM